MSNPAVRPFNSIFINKPNPNLLVSGSSVSIGPFPVGAGTNSIQIGNGAVTTTSVDAIAIGRSAISNGNIDGIAIGWNARCGAGSTASVSVGTDTNATAGSTNAVAVGHGAQATGDNAVAIGNAATAGENEIALGSSASTAFRLMGGATALPAYANEAAAAAGGVPLGGFYRTAADPSVVCIRVVP
jgi:autotransporter adhesin